MCGRIYIKTSLDQMIAAFMFAAQPDAVQGLANDFPRYNGGPGKQYPIIVHDVVADGGKRGAIWARAHWGLMPPWWKPGGAPAPINARGETVATNGMFRGAYKSRRALLPIAGGYFEWHDIYANGKNKQPYAIAMADDKPFCMAAIWESRRDPELGLEMRSFAIVTCAPNEMMATIHDRMPVILDPADYERWLTGEDPADLIKPYPSERMRMWPVGRAVGSVRNNTADLLDEVDISAPPPAPKPKPRKPTTPKAEKPKDPDDQGDLF